MNAEEIIIQDKINIKNSVQLFFFEVNYLVVFVQSNMLIYIFFFDLDSNEMKFLKVLNTELSIDNRDIHIFPNLEKSGSWFLSIKSETRRFSLNNLQNFQEFEKLGIQEHYKIFNSFTQDRKYLVEVLSPGVLNITKIFSGITKVSIKFTYEDRNSQFDIREYYGKNSLLKILLFEAKK